MGSVGRLVKVDVQQGLVVLSRCRTMVQSVGDGTLLLMAVFVLFS